MTHVAIQQADETGSPVVWGEHVSDEQYTQAPALESRWSLMRATVMYGARRRPRRERPRPLDRRADRRDPPRHPRLRSAAATSGPTTTCRASETGQSMGHEAIGVVEDVGARRPQRQAGRARRDAVRDLRRHLRVLPRGTAHRLRPRRLLRQRRHQRRPGRGAADPVRRRHAVSRSPVGEDDALMPSLLTLSDVMGTGHHAAVVAQSRPATRSRSSATAPSVCAASSPPSASAPSRSSSWAATPTASHSRASSAPPTSSASAARRPSSASRELTGGDGAHSVLECVGTEDAIAHRGRDRASRRRRRPRRRPALRGDPGRAAVVLQERHGRRRPRAGPRLHRRAAARRPRGPDRARPRLRPHRRPRRRAGRLPRDGRARVDQGDGEPVMKTRPIPAVSRHMSSVPLFAVRRAVTRPDSASAPPPRRAPPQPREGRDDDGDQHEDPYPHRRENAHRHGGSERDRTRLPVAPAAVAAR